MHALATYSFAGTVLVGDHIATPNSSSFSEFPASNNNTLSPEQQVAPPQTGVEPDRSDLGKSDNLTIEANH